MNKQQSFLSTGNQLLLFVQAIILYFSALFSGAEMYLITEITEFDMAYSKK